METRKCLCSAWIVGVLALPLASASGAVTASKELPDGEQFTVDGGTLRIQFWSDDIVRVTYATAAELPTLKSLSVVASPAAMRLTRQQDDQAFTLVAPDLKVRIDKQTGAVGFLDSAGHLLLREAAQGRKIGPTTVAGAAVTSCAQSFELSPDEGIYGLGQHQRDAWNYLAGGAVRLAQANMDVGIPVMTSSRGVCGSMGQSRCDHYFVEPCGRFKRRPENPALVVGSGQGH